MRLICILERRKLTVLKGNKLITMKNKMEIILPVNSRMTWTWRSTMEEVTYPTEKDKSLIS